MIWFALVFHIALIAVAYAIGRDKGINGVIFFLVGAVFFQMATLGPGSFTGCQPDWDGRSNPTYCQE